MSEKEFDFTKKKRVVVKIGSSSLNRGETGNLNFTKLEHLVREICDMRNRGMDVCLVSSGAIAVGRQTIGLNERPKDISTKQACAAVGQARLMMTYQRMFAEYNQIAGQILMTKNTMVNPVSRANAKNTFDELFHLGVIPVVNENDTVSTYEMQFGDNDTLSAIVSSLVGADLLILLSDIDGLFTDDPHKNPDAKLIKVVDKIDTKLLGMAKGSTGSDVGTGGMATKLTAAKIATYSGADMIIANGGNMGILYDIMNRFRKENKSVIFISHDLDEIMEVCDTLTVLRDGKIIRTFEKAEFEAGAIRASMIGRELQGDYYRSDFQASSQPEVALDVRNLVYEDRLKGISFQVHKGEIVGIGGLAHCGMHSLGKVCFGALKPEEGSVTVEDGTIIDSPAIAMKKRVGYVSKDRDVESLCLNASIEDNISIAGMSEFAINNFLILKNREKKYVNHQIEELSIKCAGRDQSVSQLSGGNKQKVVFGKWIGCGSEILILDCPTRGVDIGVKQAMYQLMVRLKNEGKSILMISEELPELIGMSDRILIMKNGEVSAEFERSETLSDAQIIEYMI